MRITLSGTLGSGKSTVGKELACRLGVRYISAGQIFRELGQISSLDALQTNLEAETNRALDDAVDDKVRELNKTTSDFVIDSRMAWHFVDDALRVFLSVTPETAAQRIMADRSRATEQYSSIEAALDGLRARRDSEIRRYRRLYNVEIENASNYDISIITDDAEIGDIVDLILRRVGGRTDAPNWIPKTRLVPMMVADGSVQSAAPVAGDLPLPLHVKENFGFFSGDAHRLARAFASELKLVPYEESGRAVKNLKPENLRAWESLTGVPLAFSRKRGPAN
jgi:predicted cytidylate kinase